ncbi:MAG: ImmA/IrrE family metallo-endopeptidase [Desulfobulbus sp.]|jgi:hypothetical protein
MKRFHPAEELLQSLGITEPSEIDLEAIAYFLGIKVKYHPLEGCEARILGVGDKGIITVNDQCSFGRQRFSIAHELGHWKYHRGRIMVCRSDEIGNFGGGSNKTSSAEKHADLYAANLLMPSYLFVPVLRSFRKFDFDTIKKIRDIFQVSLTAAAFRCVEIGDAPAVLISHNHQGRNWFFRSKLVPDRWFPREDLQPESSAMDLLFRNNNLMSATPSKYVSAAAWFDRYEARRYEVLEQSIKIGPAEILTNLVITEDDMLED